MSSIYRTAYVVTERNGRSFWNRIGVTFLNRDGSETVSLDALPVSGKLILREGTFAGAGTGAGTGRSTEPSETTPQHKAPPGFDKELDDDDIPF